MSSIDLYENSTRYLWNYNIANKKSSSVEVLSKDIYEQVYDISIESSLLSSGFGVYTVYFGNHFYDSSLIFEDGMCKKFIDNN